MANGFRPSDIVVPSQLSYDTSLGGRKSYTDLLQQGKNRAQDGRGVVYSEMDHRNFSHAGGTVSASIPSDSDEGGAVKDSPVQSTGSSGLLGEKGVALRNAIGKSGPR